MQVPPQTLLIGVGNDYRGDDGVGRLIVRKIAAMNLPGVQVAEASGEGTALMALWSSQPRIFLFDAAQSGARPGTIHRIDTSRSPVPTGFLHYSTHAFSVAEAIELSRVLATLPETLILYGVEGARFDHGDQLSPSVAQAAEQIVETVARELQGM